MPKDISRQYSRVTLRRLDTLSGNECAHPDCTKKLIAEDGMSIISKICHIAAASKNGPRYDKNMSDDEHNNQLSTILVDLANTINCQFILPIVRDKIPADLDIEDYTILKLSQNEKLFNIK